MYWTPFSTVLYVLNCDQSRLLHQLNFSNFYFFENYFFLQKLTKKIDTRRPSAGKVHFEAPRILSNLFFIDMFFSTSVINSQQKLDPQGLYCIRWHKNGQGFFFLAVKPRFLCITSLAGIIYMNMVKRYWYQIYIFEAPTHIVSAKILPTYYLYMSRSIKTILLYSTDPHN